MKVVDANLLIYATNPSSPVHVEARQWWARAANDPEPIGLPWVVVIACLRIFTSPSAFSTPLPPSRALEIIETWLGWPHVEALSPRPDHLQRMRTLMHHARFSAAERVDLRLNDVHIAALALEHGATVYTCDKGFSRYPQVRHVDPLAGSIR